MPIHFGVIVRPGKKGLYLTRDKYAIISNRSSFYSGLKIMGDNYTDESLKFYTEEWCNKHKIRALENYDLNMKFYENLNRNTFNNEVDAFLKKNKKFKNITDLKEYENKPGYYIMILDEYKQIYIGTCENIMKRVRQHWTKNKQFDRLIFGSVETSKLSIDSFRAMDTTRIYVWTTKKTYSKENDLINQFSKKFICNRINGGRLDMEVLEIKTRDLKM